MTSLQSTSLGWAPAIPSHWKVVPLSFIAKMGTGHTPDRSKSEYWENCTVPWVTTPDVTRRGDSLTPLMETEQLISELGMSNSAAVLHPKGTVMLSRTASIGHSTRIGRPMATTQAFVTWHAGPDLDSRYLLLVMRAMKQEWQRLAYGSTHLTIYMPDLESIRIPLPPLEEQRRIADFLDAETTHIDRMVSIRSAQLNLLAEREKAMLDRAFSKATSGVPTRLKRLFSVRPRYGVLVPQFVDEGIPFIRVNDLLNLEDRAASLRRIPAELSAQYARTVVKPGDLLVSVVGTLGRSAIASESAAGANIARAVCSIRVSNDVEVELVQAWLSTSLFRTQAQLATSTDTAQPTLGMEDLGNFTLVWPTNSDERRRLLSTIRAGQSNLSQLDHRLRRQVELLAERRQALITAAVTGQFDVSTASGQGVDVP
ncbi:restriction endonuclease subunit S [Kitasatospora sp. MY 5-36]|uniref:restriction endonuclease subunit S n=1 Tax=Kitasatospora sp. MY 5-36 TaxID=1678027 RepID=UPI0009E7AC99|nr:restriction endonuclease subunit S [Kitasatospora sp. MY 5-36]